jgi:hypothetical protein
MEDLKKSQHAPRCQAARKDGSPCQGAALPGSTFCFAHAPERAAARAAGNARGGSHSKRAHRMARLAPLGLRPVTETLYQVLDELHSGEIPPNVATAMATVASAIVKCLTAGELEERVRRLEEEQPHVNTR